MDATRRRGIAPVPADLDNHLTQAQLSGLGRAEGFGWSIKFVRRATVVLVYKDGSTLGVLEGDGTLNQKTRVHERTDGDPGANDPDSPRSKKFLV